MQLGTWLLLLQQEQEQGSGEAGSEGESSFDSRTNVKVRTSHFCSEGEQVPSRAEKCIRQFGKIVTSFASSF